MEKRNLLGKLKGLAGVLIALLLAAAILFGAGGCLNVNVDPNAVRINDNKYEIK
jgi:hypothetical protein